MTIQQLRYFLALCEDLNYTHTAGRMYLSRQALRQSIAALEDELCGKLFVNNRNHLALTEKGERFRAQAAPVVQQFDALCQQAYQDIQSAPLRLGISVALVPDYLPNLGEVLEAFRQQYPGIPLELASLSNDEVPVQLQRGAWASAWHWFRTICPIWGRCWKHSGSSTPASPWSLLPCPTMKCRSSCNGAHWMPGW